MHRIMTNQSLPSQPYKGARDFYPEDKRQQKYLFSTMRRVAERFGYEEYDAPILESLELYKAKSGEEIVNEQTYNFTDRGGREVVIRPEMTPSVSRMIAAKRQELSYPVRWYSIPNLWRYERPQRGRLREHWQLNVDIFGVEGLAAEHELILVADSLLNEFGATRDMYIIRINSRQLMDFIMTDYLGLDSVQSHTLSKLIDRIEKIPREVFIAEVDAMFTPTQKDTGASEKLLQILQVKKLSELPEYVKQSEPAQQLQELLTMLQESTVSNAQFDITIMRGFDYYTGIVFEIADTDPKNNRAMMGGGRYDGLVGLFGVEPVPTAGFGWGDVTLQNFLDSHNLAKPLKPTTDVYVALIGDVYSDAQKLLATLRAEGLNVAVDDTDRKLGSKIKSALKQQVRYVLFVGEEELKTNQFKLKDLRAEQEQTLSPERITSSVLDSRN